MKVKKAVSRGGPIAPRREAERVEAVRQREAERVAAWCHTSMDVFHDFRKLRVYGGNPQTLKIDNRCSKT